MKKIVVLIALFMLVKPALPVVEYIINYDYIVKELCENKDKPALKCNGKCHLAKQLAKASEDEKPISSDKKQNVKQEIETMFCQEFSQINVPRFFVFTTKKINASYHNFYASCTSHAIFHPPLL